MKLRICVLTGSQVVLMQRAGDHTLESKAFFKDLKIKVFPSPSFVPCLCSAPVACVVRIAGILITQPQPSARIPGDPGKHTLLQGHGQVTESRLPEPAMVFSFPPLPQTRD